MEIENRGGREKEKKKQIRKNKITKGKREERNREEKKTGGRGREIEREKKMSSFFCFMLKYPNLVDGDDRKRER